MKGFTKEDSSRIGFVTSCLFYDALDVTEMQQWILKLLEETDSSPPLYLVELLEFDAPLAHIHKVIGFVPHWPFSEDAKEALFGIAFKRGRQPYGCPISRETALHKLTKYPQVESTFRAELPFIDCK
jgi:hypothetical protein